MKSNGWLIESLKTVSNIVDTVVILDNIGKENLIPTQLELLYIEAAQLVEDFCVKRTDPIGYVE